MTDATDRGPAAGSATTAQPDFEEFCRVEHARLARALSLALNNHELGRDAAAEAMARAWERWDQVRNYDNIAGWMYRVGLNWGRSRLRRRRREVDAVFTPERSVPAIEADRVLADALATLSHDHRAVVVGRYFLDWSEADLAAALDIAPGTVKSRLSRALDHLARRLEHSDD